MVWCGTAGSLGKGGSSSLGRGKEADGQGADGGHGPGRLGRALHGASVFRHRRHRAK